MNEITNNVGTIMTEAELALLEKMASRGIPVDVKKVKAECEIVEKKERESHIDFCTDSDNSKNFRNLRAEVKKLKPFDYEKTTLTTTQAKNLGSNYKKVAKVVVKVQSYDINAKAVYTFLDSNGKEVEPAKKESD